MSDQPRLNRIQRAIRRAHASSDAAERATSMRKFLRRVRYIRHMPVGRVRTSSVLGLEA
jgi:hypothetical protein